MQKNTLSFLGLLFAMVLLHIALEYYNVVTKKLFSLYMLANPLLTVWLFRIVLILLTVLVAYFFSQLPAKTYIACFLLLEGFGLLLYVVLLLALTTGIITQRQPATTLTKIFTLTNELNYTFYLWTVLTILYLFQTPRVPSNTPS